MRVFLSWSGERSQYVAEQFSEWLPVVVQGVETFMSKHDVDAGSRWAREIDEQLEATDFGVLFVTPESQHEPWLVHEAGALGKSIEESRVVPMLIDMSPSDLDWPLARFQAKSLNKPGIWDLVDSINKARGDDQRDAEVLEKAFNGQWSDLESGLEGIPPLSESEPTLEEATLEEAQTRRDEKLDEVLELVRSITRDPGLKIIADRLDEIESVVRKTSERAVDEDTVESLREERNQLETELHAKTVELHELKERIARLEDERKRELEDSDDL